MDDKNEQALIKAEEITRSVLTTNDKLELALETVTNIEEHDTEMDLLAREAMLSYQELCTLGRQTKETVAPKMFEVAASMLRVSLDAKNSKVDAKLQMIEKQLKKRRLELFEVQEENKRSVKSHNSSDESDEVEFDRNQVMKMILDNS